MKKIILISILLALCIKAFTQKFCGNQLAPKGQMMSIQKLIPFESIDTSKVRNKDNFIPLSKSFNSSGIIERLIGNTDYELQSTFSVGNRIYVYPDGNIAAVWTIGFIPIYYPDRGTGYNFFNGSWGPIPTTRIESVRTGWPSYQPLGEGEVIIAHQGIPYGLVMSKRIVRGTGSWATTDIPGPASSPTILRPRLCTNGNTLHLLVTTSVAMEGLENALLYYRSTNGGISWETHRILPGLDTSSLAAGAGKSFSGFGNDEYAWAEPKGDTIAFAVNDKLGGIWIMKSYDNGETWAKTTVLSIPVYSVPPTPIMASTDGSIAIDMDNSGKAHIVFGRMFVQDSDFTNHEIQIFPFTDGLIYWNENMAQLDTTQLADWDGLIANGNLIASMIDYSNNGIIDFPEVHSSQYPFGLYDISLTSMGQIAIDDDDNIVVTYSSCREDLVNQFAYPNAELYRHLYTTAKLADSQEWLDPRDLTDDIEHADDECVYGSLAATSKYYDLHLVYHLDWEPGIGPSNGGGDQYAEKYVNYLNYYDWVKTKPIDIAKYVEVSPNPARDFANVVVSLTANEKVELNVYDVMGKLVMSNNYGQQSSGYHTYQVNTSNLTSGMYLFTVKIGNNQTSKKVVVE